jgi:hypothetical protein
MLRCASRVVYFAWKLLRITLNTVTKTIWREANAESNLAEDSDGDAIVCEAQEEKQSTNEKKPKMKLRKQGLFWSQNELSRVFDSVHVHTEEELEKGELDRNDLTLVSLVFFLLIVFFLGRVGPT